MKILLNTFIISDIIHCHIFFGSVPILAIKHKAKEFKIKW